MTSADDYGPGDVIGSKYELESLLGEGGMGTVWAARNQLLDAPVAIKLIRSETDRAAGNQRLLQEARASARLVHPSIVRIFDVGQTERGDPFIVMERLSGDSLANILIREQRFSPVEAVRLMLPIASALVVAHGKGIVHRDVKPDNVFLAQDDERIQPKLVDFGIAKLEQRDGRKLTQTGTIVGSPEYMSPEQARGEEEVDARSDTWSFAVMLYELISGRMPFEAANYNALLRAILEETPTSLLDLSAADTELSAAIDVGMAKDPSLRWRSMREFGMVLARWLMAQGVAEDIAGNSVEAVWLKRATDSAVRVARSSLASISDGMTGSGIAAARHATELAAAPLQNLSPSGANSSKLRVKGPTVLFALFGVAALVAGIAFGLRKPVESPLPTAEVATPSRAPAVMVSAAPTSVPRHEPAAPQPAPEKTAPTVEAEPAELSPAPKQRAPARSGGRARATAEKPKSRPPAAPAPAPRAPANDLLAPY